MATEVGHAYVTLLPSARGFGARVSQEISAPIIAAGRSAGDTAGTEIGERVRKQTKTRTSKLGSEVGTSIAVGMSSATSRVGDVVGRRISKRLGSAIGSTGETIGLKLGTGVETAMSAPLQRTETAARKSSNRVHGVFRASLGRVGALSASVFASVGANAAAAAGVAGVAASAMGIKYVASLESATAAFETMLGSAKRAHSFLKQLETFAASTPFEFPDLVAASQKLLAFGFSAKEVIPTLRTIGDTAAGLGGSAEVVQQIITAVGQMQAKGKVQGDELLQLTEVGVPALRILANQYGVTTTEMSKMLEEGKVKSEKAVPAILAGMKRGTKGAAGTTTAFAGLMQKQSQTLTGIWSNFTDVANKALGNLVSPAIPHIKTALKTLTGILSGPKKFLASLFGGGSGGAAATRGVGGGAFISSLTKMWKDLKAAVQPAINVIVPALKEIWTLIQTNLVPAFKALLPAIQPIVSFLLKIFGAILLDTIKSVIQVIKSIIKIISGVINVIAGVLTGDWSRVWQGIKQIVSGVITGIWSFLKLILIGKIGALFRVAGRFLKKIWNGLWNGLKRAVNWIGGLIRNAVETVWKWITTPFKKGRQWLSDLWNKFWGWLKDKAYSFGRTIYRNVKGFLDNVKDGFRKGVEAIKRIWNGIKNAVRKPVQFVVDVVYNRGIRGAWNTVARLVGLKQLPWFKFAKGGIYPGYTPGRDVGMAAVSGGEAIMRPEWTRAVGAKGVHAMNAAARTGGVSGVQNMLANGGFAGAFAKGGIVGNIIRTVKNAKDFVVKGASALLDGGASGFARQMLKPILNQLGGIGTSKWAKMLARMPSRMINGFINWLKKFIDPKLGGQAAHVVKAAASYLGVGDRGRDNDNVFNRMWGWGAGTPWCANFVSAAIKKAKAGKNYAGYPTAAVNGYYRNMRKVPFSSARPGDLRTTGTSSHINIVEKVRGGRLTTIGGNEGPAVRRSSGYQYGHILRPRFAKGGIVKRDALQVFGKEAPRAEDPRDRRNPLSTLYHQLATEGPLVRDSGGLLPKGLSAVYNGTGENEVISTMSQFRDLVSAAATRGRGDARFFENSHVTFEDATDVDKVFQRMAFDSRAYGFGG